MGEPTTEVKTEDGAAKKVKLEAAEAEEGAPEAKKVKVEVEEKAENGAANGGQKLTAEERGVPGLEAEIVTQVEYYFGDYNLPKDKFLQEQIKLEDGWIPIDIMLRFQRLSSLSNKPATIVSCLRGSSTLMEVNEDGTKIRRSPNKPLPERNDDWQKLINERTVYVKGFPQDQPGVGQYIEFFKAYGPVQHINLRKYQEKDTKKWLFKGSANILFETKELADKFLALDSVKYNDVELIRMTHEAHSLEKKKEKDERWGKKVKKAPKEEQKTAQREFAKSCVLKLTNIQNEELTREEIKASLTELEADVGFIDYSKGDKEALVRLRSTEDGAATQFLSKLGEEAKLKVGEEQLEISVLGGDEELAYFEKTRQSLDRFQKNHRGKKNHNRGGGRFKGNKRGRSPGRDGPPAKIKSETILGV